MKQVEHDVPGVGRFVLTKPKAGKRNKAMIESGGLDTETQRMKFSFAILPQCVKTHPFGNLRGTLTEALDNMETDQYDSLLGALGKLFQAEGDVEKKSEQSSESGESKAATS